MQRALAHHQLIVDGKWIHISVSNLFRLVSENLMYCLSICKQEIHIFLNALKQSFDLKLFLKVRKLVTLMTDIQVCKSCNNSCRTVIKSIIPMQ